MRHLVGLLLLCGCSVYDESLLVADAGFDPQSCRWGECWWSESSGQCKSADQPQADERPAESPGQAEEIVVALRRIWLGETLPPGADAALEPWQTLGFDLDGLCTSPAGCSADPGPASCSNAAGVLADGALCRDNALAKLLSTAPASPLGAVFGVSEDKLNCGLRQGSFSVLVKITGYDGGPNDSNVRVDVYPALDVEPALPYECTLENWQSQLTWDANYVWKLDRDALETPASGIQSPSKISDPAAYVRNGYLVARFLDPTELSLASGLSVFRGLSLTLFKPVLTGRMTRDLQGLWRIDDGIIAGRTRRDDLIDSVREAGFCDGADYDAFVESVDGTLDVLANGSNAESAACDALSVGIGFEAEQSQAGAAVEVPAAADCPTN